MSVTKLSQVVTKDSPFVGELEPGHHVVTLSYKTDTVTKIKRDSESWIVPKLKGEFILSDSATILSAIEKFIDDRQELALREVADGDLEYMPMLSDVESLLQEYITDRRGERKGIKQSALVDWIKSSLMPYFAARMERNLPNSTKEQRQAMMVAFHRKFDIAATRSNRRGNDTLPIGTLDDLAKRLMNYSDVKQHMEHPEYVLPKSDELTALVSRISGHMDAIRKSDAEISMEDF